MKNLYLTVLIGGVLSCSGQRLCAQPETAPAAPREGFIELSVRNDCGSPVSGLRLRFDRPLDPATPFEMTVPTAPFGPFMNFVLSPDGHEMVFDQAIIPQGGIVPSGVTGAQFRFLPEEEGPSLRVLESAWQSGGQDVHAFHLLRLVNPAAAAADRLEIAGRDATGALLTALSLAPAPDPLQPFGCAGQATGIGPHQFGVNWPCPVAAGFPAPWVQFTLDGAERAERLNITWLEGGGRIAQQLWLNRLTNVHTPSVGLALAFNQPVERAVEDNHPRFHSVIGLGKADLYFCEGTVGVNQRFGPVTFTTTNPSGSSLALRQAQWRRAQPHPLIPDAIYLSFDEGNPEPGGATAQLAIPSPRPLTAAIENFDTGSPGQFGSGLVGRSGTSYVSTGIASNLGTGSWSVMYWIDLSRSTSPSLAQMMFSDYGARDWYGAINFDGNGSLRLHCNEFHTIRVYNALTFTRPHHVAHVYDANLGTIATYIDSVAADLSSVTALNLQGGSEVWVGRHETRGYSLRTGTVMDEFRLYRRALSPTEIVQVADTPALAFGVQAPFETNDAEATLEFDATRGNPLTPARTRTDTRSTMQVNLDSVNWNFPYDLIVSTDSVAPAGAGGFEMFDGQIINMDLNSPGTTLTLGGFVQPFVPSSFPVLPTTPLQLTAQLAVASPTTASGITVSAPATVVVQQPTGIVGVRAQASGHGNYTNDPTKPPFWTITHDGTGPPITRVTFTIDANDAPHLANMRFDLDDPFNDLSMIIYGNGAHAPCLGSYRDGTDVSTGLIYDSLNTYIRFDAGEGCLGGNCGFISTYDSRLPAEETRQVTFRFVPGAFFGNHFAFGLDTDGTASGGRDMAGMRVTIELVTGQVLSGLLQVDPALDNASALNF